MRGGPMFEREGTQRIIMVFASLGFIALLVGPALDHRFGWSAVPIWGVVLGDVFVVVGFYFIFLVYRENTFTAATIEVVAGHQVITTGPYAVVRHPMYASGSLYMLGTPLALGSYWAFLALAGMLPFLFSRLLDDERILTRDLPGYAEYRRRVRHRLVVRVVASTDMSQEDLVIRRAAETDLSKVETVARTTWPVAYAGIIPDVVQRRLLDRWYSPESLRSTLAAQGSSFFVAESRGDVIGFAQFVRRSAESAELTRIYVLPDRQRSGIGRQLLEAGLTEFAAEGLKHLTVEVERDNGPGRRFYERAGFAEPRELTRDVQGYVLALVEYRRPVRNPPNAGLCPPT